MHLRKKEILYTPITSIRLPKMKSHLRCGFFTKLTLILNPSPAFGTRKWSIATFCEDTNLLLGIPSSEQNIWYLEMQVIGVIYVAQSVWLVVSQAKGPECDT